MQLQGQKPGFRPFLLCHYVSRFRQTLFSLRDLVEFCPAVVYRYFASTLNRMSDWPTREKRPLRGPRPDPPGPAVKNYITPAGLQRLKDEHAFLLRRERPAVVEVVAWAASNGDRSENADYLYGKRRLNQIDSRIRFLTKRIDAAVVVDPAARRPASAATRIFFGATVTYRDAAGLQHVVSIVGIDEVDTNRGYISWRSPLANALMKASPGDRVELRAPARTERLEIIDVEYAPIPIDPFREPPGAQSTPKAERA
jgi:transcription elongation factor GreB